MSLIIEIVFFIFYLSKITEKCMLFHFLIIESVFLVIISKINSWKPISPITAFEFEKKKKNPKKVDGEPFPSWPPSPRDAPAIDALLISLDSLLFYIETLLFDFTKSCFENQKHLLPLQFQIEISLFWFHGGLAYNHSVVPQVRVNTTNQELQSSLSCYLSHSCREADKVVFFRHPTFRHL